MSETHPGETRPYHHGDLRRALVTAARRLLETDGPAALSLRAVAREAGVSVAAPYHHFKDKGELLDDVAHQGWDILNEQLAEVGERMGEAPYSKRMAVMGVAYVRFAREHPALYRLMYDCSRDRAAMPDHSDDKDSAFCRVREMLVNAGADPNDKVGLELAATAAWCAAHGLAEMAGFKQFEWLKNAMGGEEAFLQGVFEHIHVFASGIARASRKDS